MTTEESYNREVNLIARIWNDEVVKNKILLERTNTVYMLPTFPCHITLSIHGPKDLKNTLEILSNEFKNMLRNNIGLELDNNDNNDEWTLAIGMENIGIIRNFYEFEVRKTEKYYRLRREKKLEWIQIERYNEKELSLKELIDQKLIDETTLFLIRY